MLHSLAFSEFLIQPHTLVSYFLYELVSVRRASSKNRFQLRHKKEITLHTRSYFFFIGKRKSKLLSKTEVKVQVDD